MNFINKNIADTTPFRILGTHLLLFKMEGKSSYPFVEIYSQTLIEMKKFLLLVRRSIPMISREEVAEINKRKKTN